MIFQYCEETNFIFCFSGLNWFACDCEVLYSIAYYSILIFLHAAAAMCLASDKLNAQDVPSFQCNNFLPRV